MPRSQRSRASRRSPDRLEEVFIPEKLYFRIGEVSKLTRTKEYVLRYWETEFPSLRPAKSSTGHRLYRRRDVELVLEIRRLLYTQGFTIEGARKKLSGEAGSRQEKARQQHLFQATGAEGTGSAKAALDESRLRSIRRELQGILNVLSKKSRDR